MGALKEPENESKQHLNQSESTSEGILGTGLYDNQLEKVNSDMEDTEQAISQEKHSIVAGLEVAVRNGSKAPAAGKKTVGKRLSGRTKAE